MNERTESQGGSPGAAGQGEASPLVEMGTNRTGTETSPGESSRPSMASGRSLQLLRR